MRLGLGPSSGEIHKLLAEAGETGAAVTRLVERRFLEWPSGPTQEEVKQLEHEADQVVSSLLSLSNTMFVTPYDRDDIVTLAFAVDDVADEAENAAELLGLYGIEMPTKQSFALCASSFGPQTSSRRSSASSATCTARPTGSVRSRRSRTKRTTSRARRARACSRTIASTR